MSINLEQASGAYGVFAVATAGAALTGLSGAATTYSTSAFGFANRGKVYAKAAVAGGTTPTTDGNTGSAMTLTASQAAVFVWAIDTSGTVKVFKGPTVSWTDSTASSTACHFPPLPGDVTPFAYHTVQAGSTTSGTWTFGSSNWNATGISAVTVVNIAGQLPNTPALTT